MLQIEGLTAIQCIVLDYLYENGARDVFQRDLEVEFQIRRSTVTGILQGMERRGLISRQPVEQDARLKKLVLTEAGLRIHAKAEQHMREVESRLGRRQRGRPPHFPQNFGKDKTKPDVIKKKEREHNAEPTKTPAVLLAHGTCHYEHNQYVSPAFSGKKQRPAGQL